MYRPGYNLPVGEPGSDGYKLTSFATMKSLADAYSILRTCLEIRKNEIRALDWDIVLTRDAAKAYRGDRAAMRDFGERQAKAKKWFRKPDPNYFTFSSWLHAMMDQVFAIDALSLYMCPTKARGRGTGLLGSGLDSLWLVDGASIRPLVGLHGGTPAPPAPGYEQYGYGVPRSDYTMMLDGSDLIGAGFTREDLKGEFRGDQLLYLPYLQRPDSPYGFGLVEQAVIPIMTGLRKQAFQLSYFDESTIPAVYISPGDVNMTATQIRELQDALNAIAGDIDWRYKVIVLPPGSKTMPQKDIQIVDQSRRVDRHRSVHGGEHQPDGSRHPAPRQHGRQPVRGPRDGPGAALHPRPHVHEADAEVRHRDHGRDPAGRLRPAGHALDLRGHGGGAGPGRDDRHEGQAGPERHLLDRRGPGRARRRAAVGHRRDLRAGRVHRGGTAAARPGRHRLRVGPDGRRGWQQRRR